MFYSLNCVLSYISWYTAKSLCKVTSFPSYIKNPSEDLGRGQNTFMLHTKFFEHSQEVYLSCGLLIAMLQHSRHLQRNQANFQSFLKCTFAPNALQRPAYYLNTDLPETDCCFQNVYLPSLACCPVQVALKYHLHF